MRSGGAQMHCQESSVEISSGSEENEVVLLRSLTGDQLAAFAVNIRDRTSVAQLQPWLPLFRIEQHIRNTKEL
ncbi:hypothetical protein Y032_1481g3890 [Ancylostoma ceylanicum]|uniref:Uncharacterized protein n=1 Tax=Ancylostoma ceylanicum TaxID=53326 RepID=A0A016W541_9BILA|nr:hypothetical protein Y032_1481g3890 [Ancylostoma ceylanicum]